MGIVVRWEDKDRPPLLYEHAAQMSVYQTSDKQTTNLMVLRTDSGEAVGMINIDKAVSFEFSSLHSPDVAEKNPEE